MMSLINMVRGLENDSPAKKLIHYWIHDADTLTFWRASSNFVYLFQMHGKPHFLRFIHEKDHSIEHIQAELDFMWFLMDKGYPAAALVPSRNGKWIETVTTENGNYHGVVFEQAKGVHIPLHQMSDLHYSHWGQSLAALHHLSESYRPIAANAASPKSWKDALDFVFSVLQSHPQEIEALQECVRLKSLLSELPSGAGQTGLIHYDFQPDNLFYMKEASRYSVIDFDDSMYHWLMMDITSALSDLIEQNDAEAQKNIECFISGYKSVKHLDIKYVELMPLFQRFSDLYTFARLLRSMQNMDIPDLPEWVIQLQHKLLRKCDQIRAGFQPLIVLRKITANDWFASTQLEVTNEQKAFFPVPIVYWLAESAYCNFIPLAIYAEEEQIGFAVYAVDPGDGNYWIMAFMIDKNFQSKGFGRIAMNALIRYIKTEHNCNKILLGHRPENERAANLYTSLGFMEIKRNDSEVIRQLFT
ncbi:GNAT family N-acetyltransferase [Paenibacillus eucommiae]|uniref:Bifunctional AAC/APH n=1 Tax=Paenibacillus eucommiae TaxID=1355755 RepID=A0ABS4J9Y9_9BACL|nr:GNAT family N-acetyltransferase [Paenibacillus eucommiae]MBP1996665.1 Ser/Thr protein kinase RdoA (MazF antagonist)/ribosomal protein S18 acetylase RimI-like enzyme [Paenibacillus eucommiae]